LGSIDFDAYTDGQRNTLISSKYLNLDPRIATELGYKKTVFIRGGINNFQQVKNIDGSTSYNVSPAIGVGLKLNKIQIDYALGNAFNQGLISASNIVSLKLMIR
jgi:hypothetical protein